MEFTGERYVPEIHGNIEIEHMHRYLLAVGIANEKVVLDIACGEGYGSSMLATEAKSVIGIDVSKITISHATAKYKKNNLQFMVGDCTNIPLPDNSIDLVVSFETIEHIEKQEQMLSEEVRVLKPNGLLLISSPDKYHYSIETGIKNPFHINELSELEFKDMIASSFKYTVFGGQRVIYGSTILFESTQSKTKSFLLKEDGINSASGLIKPLYWIALASNALLPVVESGFLECPINESEIVQAWSKVVLARDNTIKDQQGRIIELEQLINSQLGSNQLMLYIKSWWITKSLRAVKKFILMALKFIRGKND